MNGQSFHNVNKITTDGVAYSNANAVSLKLHGTQFDGSAYEFTTTVFGLPTHIADALNNLLSSDDPAMTEAEIRADERRKIAEKLGLDAA